MPPGSPLNRFQPGPVARNGLSLARNSGRLSSASVPGSTFPACYFAPYRALPPLVRLFGSTTTLCTGALPPPAAASLPEARCGCSRPVRQAATCDLHSPSGVLPPLGLTRSTALAACQPAWRIRPIAVRSPAPYLFLVSAPDQRSRLASVPPAGCSSNLLEPPSLCSETVSRSMPFVNAQSDFNNFYLP